MSMQQATRHLADPARQSAGQAQARQTGRGASVREMVDAGTDDAKAGKPARPGLAHQVFGYFGVSATQTVLEFAVFAILQLLRLPNPVPSALSIVCSGAYNFVVRVSLADLLASLPSA